MLNSFFLNSHFVCKIRIRFIAPARYYTPPLTSLIALIAHIATSVNRCTISHFDSLHQCLTPRPVMDDDDNDDDAQICKARPK